MAQNPLHSGEQPEVYEDDVVCLVSDAQSAEIIYGIVLETAWGNEQEQEEEQQSDEDEDEEEEEEEEEEDRPKGKGKGKSNAKDEDEDDDDDEYEDDTLAPGCVRVAWPNRMEEELPATSLRVCDRSFLHGDVVVARNDQQGQIGTVTDVELLVDIKFEGVNGGAHTLTLSRVPAASLDHPHPFIVGRYVTRGSMLGMVSDCHVEIDVAFGPNPFAPAGLVTIKKPAPSMYKPKLASKEELHEDEVGHGVYYPGMRVKAKHKYWKQSASVKWKEGTTHLAATGADDEGTVLRVRPVEVFVDWISGDDAELMQSRGSSTLAPDECTLLGLFEETRWQVGDHTNISGQLREHHAQRIQQEEAEKDAKNNTTGSTSAAAAAAAVAAADSSAAPAGKKGKKGKVLVPSAPRDLTRLFAFCGTIVRTYTSIRILWQDGVQSGWQPALNFVSRDHLLDDDFMVHDYAVMNGPEQRLVHVLAVNHRERMVHVRYLRRELQQSEVMLWADPSLAPLDRSQPPPADSPEEGHTEWVPVFDLKTNPALEYSLGGLVVRVPGARDDATSGALGRDAHMGHAGQVLLIDQGVVTVVWADLSQSTVEADQLLIVEHDDEAGGGDDEEGEDDEEYEDEEESDEEPQESPPAAAAASVPAQAVATEAQIPSAEESESDSSADDSFDDSVSSSAPGVIPVEWTNKNFWKKGAESDVAAAPVSSSSASDSSSSGAAAADATSVESALTSLSLSGSTARPAFDYSSFDILDDSDDHSSAHALKVHKWNSEPFAPQSSKDFAKRVRGECKQLSSALPNGVHLRGYSSRMDLFSVLIAGSVGTPCYLNVFSFDMRLPADYPHSPPVMHFHSRGHRMNPNLYLDGNICLSLLNTWKSSHSSERWDPAHSTILQLLVSLQGLVIGSAKPYYLEAGYERQKGQKQACLNSHLYNETALLTSLAHLNSYSSSATPLAAAPFDLIIAEHLRSAHVQQCTRELNRTVTQWEQVKRKELSQFGANSASDTAAPSSSSSSATENVSSSDNTSPSVSVSVCAEDEVKRVLAQFAILNGDQVSPASNSASAPLTTEQNAAATAAAATATTTLTPLSTTSVSVYYHPSLAFVSMLVRQMRSLISSLDRIASESGNTSK